MAKKTSTYSISDLAQEFGVTTRAIRHYEELQLLQPERQGQKRIYSPADRTKLKLIVRGKRIGLSLQESGELLSMYEPGGSNVAQLERMLEYIGTSREKLSQQLRDISAMLDELDKAETGCQAELETLRKSRALT